MSQTVDQAGPDRIEDEGHDDWDRRRGTLCHLSANRTVHNDHVDPAADQFGDQLGYPIIIAFGGTPFDHDVASLRVARVSQSPPEVQCRFAVGRQSHEQEPDTSRRYRLLLCARRERACRRAAEQNDELSANDHSITLSARMRRKSGTVNPRALAVLRLRWS